MSLSRLRRHSASGTSIGASTAAKAAHWPTCGAQTNVYCWSIVQALTMSAGPCTQPTRQPVMACDFENPSITTTRSECRAGEWNGAS